MEVIGRPANEYNYEFMVGLVEDDHTIIWKADCDWAGEAEKLCKELGPNAIIIHDVRIAHKERVK